MGFPGDFHHKNVVEFGHPSHSASTASAAHQRHCWNPLREESAPLPPWGPRWLECYDRNLDGFFPIGVSWNWNPKKHDPNPASKKQLIGYHARLILFWLIDIRTFVMYHHKLSYKQRGYLLYTVCPMYKTTTKNTKYTQPRQRFGRCWMWHANKSHGNQQALTSFESSGRNKKRRFLPAGASITFANPSAKKLGDFIASSPICVWPVNKKGPGFLQK